MPDEELVLQAQRGDMRAYEAIVNAYKEKIANFVFRIVNDKNEAEELAQDVFVRAYFNLGSYDPGKAKFNTWIYRIAYNLSINQIKSKKAKMARSTTSFELLYNIKDDSNIEEDLEKYDDKRLVRECLERMPVKYKSAITLFYMEELSYEEISKVKRIPINTVRTQIRRGKLVLKKIIEEHGRKQKE